MDNMNEKEYIKAIQNLELGNKDDSYNLYMSFCNFLKEKYGLVDKDYDERPTTRGNEWIEIHHIKEYELDDIAKRTRRAQDLRRAEIKNDPNVVIVIVKEEDIDNQEKFDKIYYANKKKHKDTRFFLEGLSLEELKPYNKREMLVYANKIEHFLLHYLIDSLRGKEYFSGGPNYLWDASVALDIYGFYQPTLKKIQENKEYYYSLMTSIEITKLYKKLIEWKQWQLSDLPNYWMSFQTIMDYIKYDGLANICNKSLFYELFQIIGFDLSLNLKEKINTLPYMGKVVNTLWGECLRVKDIDYTLDGKVVCRFLTNDKETYKVPEDVTEIGNYAFFLEVKKITIPTSVEKMGDNAFAHAHNLEVINYLGTKEMWNEKFPNVLIGDAKLICKKTK